MMMLCDGCRKLIDMAEEKYLTVWALGNTRLFHNEDCQKMFYERARRPEEWK